ncbi:hypothetical protein Tco_0126920 [Tanacetum coccineum]
MTEMFSFFKRNTKGEVYEKVLIRERRVILNPSLNVSRHLPVRVEDDKGKKKEMRLSNKNVVEPIELVEKEKVVDEVMDDESDGRHKFFIYDHELEKEGSSASGEGATYKGGNASIGIEETNSENGVSALALWYVQVNLTKAIEQERDAPFEIKRLNSFLVDFLEDQMIRKKPTEIENAYKDARVGISQVDMMPQISVRDLAVLTILKGRPRNET